MTLNQGNKTFAEVPPTLDALTQLVNAQAQQQALTTLFARLRPLVSTATPVVSNFSQAISRPGANNDLTEAFAALPALAQTLTTASPDSVKALQESVPITAFFGPYAPEPRGHAPHVRTDDRLLRRQRPLRAGHVRSRPRFKLGANNTLTPASAAAGSGRPEDRPAAPLPGRGDPARGRRLLAVHRQRAAELRPHRRRPNESAPPRLAGRQPAADRGGDDADRRRGRVPVLQREQRAAVRADVQHQSGAARGLGPAEGQPGADRGHARGDRQLAERHSRDPTTGRITAIAELKLEKSVRAAARRHEGDRAVGLGDRTEVPGTGKGHLRARR